MPVKTELVEITPELADKWLEKNVGNFRTVDKARVSRYAKDMASGRWDITGDTIKFTDDGVVADGQHRLLGCLESGATFKTLVVWGVSGVSNIDRGRPRTVSQWLRHLGVSNYKSVGSISRMSLMHDHGLWSAKSWGCDVVTDADVIKFATDHDDAINSAFRLSSHCVTLSRSVVATVLFVGCGKKLAESDDIAVWFANGLAEGSELSSLDAVLHLRNRFMTINNGNASKVSPFLSRMLITKAWNMTVNGDECSSSMSLRMRFTGPAKQKPIDRILTTEEAK